MITSEAISLLDKKTFRGIMSLKIDITKAFDTLDLHYLIKITIQFGFDQKFCDLILTIIHSVKLSIMINGKTA